MLVTITHNGGAFCCGKQRLTAKEKCPAIAENTLLGEGGKKIKVIVKLKTLIMRVIKFRAWDSDNAKMLYPNDECEFSCVDEKDGYRFRSDFDYTDLLDGTRKGLIPLEFTGLKDELGIEIYEGDIVRYTMPDYEGEPVEYTEEVRFDDGGFYVEGAPVYIIQGEPKGTVVGNIYENAELLVR